MGKKRKCKHFLDGHGFYVRVVYSYRQYYTEDGEAVATDDGVHGKGRGGTVAYCENCDAVLGKAIPGGHGRIVVDKRR